MKDQQVSLTLAKQEYCILNGIYNAKEKEQVQLTYIGRNGDNNCVFSVSRLFHDKPCRTIWIMERIDLSYLSTFKKLVIPKSIIQPTKSVVTRAVKTLSKLSLSNKDISTIIVDKNSVTVVISPNSMCFKNKFSLNRI